MLRFKLSKFKQVCSSILLPRILLKNLKYSKELNYYNRALEQFSKVRKSTNSGGKDEATDKQKRIIEKCFDDKSLSASEPEACKRMSKEVKDVENEIIFTPEFYNMKHGERCDTVISRLFKNETVHDTSVDNKESNLAEDAKVQASTAKHEEEKLVQRIEVVDETPHVEAHAPKVEGFNSIPKILGGKTCEMSKSISNDEQTNLDELAKRCLGSPDNELDKIVAQELKRISQNKSQSNCDLDLVQNQCIKETGATNVCRFDRVQPVNLDTVPLIDDVARDYKEGGFIREYSTIFFTKDVDESKIDTPPPLSPYEKPALPFYEYPNKENITPEDDSKMETAAIDENIQETEIIFKDDSLERNTIDQEESQILEGEENLNPKPNINRCHQSILEPKILKTAQEDVCVRNNFIQDNIPTLNIMNSQQLFTSEAETPDMHSDSKDEPQKSSISSTFLPEGDRRTLDLPENTSISANQNPDEYFNISLPDDILTEGETVKRIFAESPVSQNIFYSALPQIELQESTDRAERVAESFLKDSHSVLEPEAKQATSVRKDRIDANLDELISKRDTSCSENSVPLSLLLKYIQERNRLEYCRKIVAKADIKLEGNKNFSGSQGEKSKSKSDCNVKPCPIQPKPKPSSASGPCKIPPCKPKKDPCAKLLPIFLSTMIRRDVSFDIAKHKNTTSPNSEVALTSLSILSEVVIQRIQKLSVQLKFHGNNNCGDAVDYARDFQPWIPIPSWPIPKKEKKRPFVCPKEGCKVPLPQPNKPCKDKQCLGLSKQSFVSRFFAP
ncbi:uncharacterized protein LOC125074723 [Vanessa atalanta]|uniref:uncharacterized protein LOC125074723 n=1 Tax=Vanessa atalanta TaxID=42275 RepID=UPI001FCDC86C|nr:uncharacterized protein LOC125074723 [Vanessa atalanta]